MKYEFLWKEPDPILLAEANISPYADFDYPLGKQMIEVVYFAERCVITAYINKEDLKKAREFGKTFLDKEEANSLLSECEKTRKDFSNLMKKVKESYSNVPNNQLLEIFNKYFSELKRIFYFFVIYRPEILIEIESEIKNELKKKIKDRDTIIDYFRTITTPSELNEIELEETEFIKLIHSLKNANQKELREKLKAHALEYPGLFLNIFSIKEAVESLLNRIKYEKDKEKGNIKEHMSKVLKKKNKLKKKQEEIFKELGNKNVERLALFLQRATSERLKLKMLWAGSEFSFLPLLTEIANRMNVSKEDFFKVIRAQNIEFFLEHSKKITKEEIEKRKSAFMFLVKDKELKFLSKSEAEKWAQQNLKPISMKVEKLVGTIANPGIVKGKVRVINVVNMNTLIKDLERFEKGNILVTQMTQPNMVIACQKASAIITDEGGITSHAAIISRELDIPCIVGTKIATKLLKDDDKVEVDANNGVIKILKGS